MKTCELFTEKYITVVQGESLLDCLMKHYADSNDEIIMIREADRDFSLSKKVEVSDEEIEKEAEKYSSINYCKAIKQSEEDAKYIQAVAENSFIEGCKWMRDKQGIAPKEVEENKRPD